MRALPTFLVIICGLYTIALYNDESPSSYLSQQLCPTGPTLPNKPCPALVSNFLSMLSSDVIGLMCVRGKTTYSAVIHLSNSEQSIYFLARSSPGMYTFLSSVFPGAPEREGGFGKTLFYLFEDGKTTDTELDLIWFGQICPTSLSTPLPAKGNQYCGKTFKIKVIPLMFATQSDGHPCQ